MTAPQDPFRTPDESAPSGGPPTQPGAATSGDGDPAGGAASRSAQAGPQPFGGPPTGGGAFGAPPPRTGGRNGLGVAALILGLLAVLTAITVFVGILFGLLAIILGVIGRGRAKRGEANNGGMALAGIILGIVGLLISSALIAVGVSVFNSETGQRLKDCIESAGSNQAAINQCRVDLENDLLDR